VDRHLLPNEIDLLLDGEVGFGVQPLKAHVRKCATCRAELDEARAIVAELEHLPHLSPSPLFAERVMARVQVFEPWHVAALNTARGWLPRSGPTRALAAAAALSMAFAMTIASLWLAANLDSVVFMGSVALEDARRAFLGAATDAVATAFGQPAMEALQSGGPLGIGLALTGLLAAVIISAAGLRRLATASRRHRA
jgi:hypothetical protein